MFNTEEFKSPEASDFYFFTNLLNLYDLNLEQLGTVNYPSWEMTVQYAMKASQIGGIMGGVFGIPMNHLLQTDSSNRDFAFDSCLNGVVLGLLSGPFLASAFLADRSTTNIRRACVRLRLNQRMLTADRYSLGGMYSGCVLTTLGIMKWPVLKGTIYGYCAGFCVGSILSGYGADLLHLS